MNKLKLTRLLQGISQLELERKSGIRQSTISVIERGYRGAKGYQKKRLAEALGISESELFSEDGGNGAE